MCDGVARVEGEVVVLFVDDEPLYHTAFVDEVRRRGHTWKVVYENRGIRAGACANKHSPNVCVLDWDYSRSCCTAGEEVVQLVRKVSTEIPIAILTKFDTPTSAAASNNNVVNQSDNRYYMAKTDGTLEAAHWGFLSDLVDRIENVLVSPAGRWVYP